MGAGILLLCKKEWSIPGMLLGIALVGIVLGVWIAFGRQNILQNSLILLGISMLFAGFFQLIPIQNVGLFCLGGTVLLPVVISGVTSVFRTKQTQKWMYEARLFQNQKEKCLTAFMDTGNRLRLYGSQLPVVLVDETYLSEWIKEAEEQQPQKLVFLPYKGVGGKGILHGIRLRCVLALGKDSFLDGEVAAVAAEHKLFQGCGYQVILQPEVLTMVCVMNTQEGENDVV